jgi:hypothetical protein
MTSGDLLLSNFPAHVKILFANPHQEVEVEQVIRYEPAQFFCVPNRPSRIPVTHFMRGIGKLD